MKICIGNFPESLTNHRKALISCLLAFDNVFHINMVILLGSHSRGDNSVESDVDLCVVAEGIKSQYSAACSLRRSIGKLRSKPPLTLIPISPSRLDEKKAIGDPFFETILREGLTIAKKD